MGLDDPTDDRQAQPEASMRARTWGIDSHEGFKHVCPLLTRNTGPVIADLNDDAGGVGLHFDDDGFVRVTQCVAQEILDGSLELALIGAAASRSPGPST